MVPKNLHVGAKFKVHGIVVRGGSPSDNCQRTHGQGYPVYTGKLVETAGGVGSYVGDHELGEAPEREAMHACTKALLNGADGLLNLTKMTVGRCNVHGNRADLANAFKLIVCMVVAYRETTGTVEVDDCQKFSKIGLVAAVDNRDDRSETDTARERV